MWVTACKRFKCGFEVVERVGVVKFAGADEGCKKTPVFAAFIMTGEQCVLAIESRPLVILPISGVKPSSITAGIRFTAGAFASRAPSVAQVARSRRLRSSPAWSW